MSPANGHSYRGPAGICLTPYEAQRVYELLLSSNRVDDEELRGKLHRYLEAYKEIGKDIERLKRSERS